MMTFIMIESITISMLFIFMKHPLSMGFTLILQTISISLITGMLTNNFWFSYVLLISSLSGTLVLFIYMASVASNEKFYSSIKMMTFLSLSMVLASLMSQWLDPLLLNKWQLMSNINIKNVQTQYLTSLFNLHILTITLLMVMYLFLTMIIISYIVNTNEGPLRTKN